MSPKRNKKGFASKLFFFQFLHKSTTLELFWQKPKAKKKYFFSVMCFQVKRFYSNKLCFTVLLVSKATQSWRFSANRPFFVGK